MNGFRKYQHLERFGTPEVENIELGECYVFPKLDGTNASIWLCDDEVQAGSRRRHLSLDEDNAGFCTYVKSQEKYKKLLRLNPNLYLYGEWLVPHSLKTYSDNSWRQFYVFDVYDSEEEKYLHYSEYHKLLEEYGINYIPPIAMIERGSYEMFIKQLDKNVFLIKDGKGVGEGIVLKNYDFVNKFGRVNWAKIVTSEFKEKHAKTMGSPQLTGKQMVEEKIADKYVTTALCEKVFSKIEDYNSKKIPQLLNTVYYDVVKEESWNFIKENKNPTINFKTLQHFVFKKVRENLPQLF